MCIRGIRDNDDVDIIVKENLWEQLEKKYPAVKKPGRSAKIRLGPVEIFSDWAPWYDDVTELIDTAEIIEGMPFVKLEYVIEWKKKFGREKDQKDIVLIEEYLKKNS